MSGSCSAHAGNDRGCWPQLAKKEDFLFEKKKQKTFAVLVGESPAAPDLLGAALGA
jgi:hypothetical protein